MGGWEFNSFEFEIFGWEIEGDGVIKLFISLFNILFIGDRRDVDSILSLLEFKESKLFCFFFMEVCKFRLLFVFGFWWLCIKDNVGELFLLICIIWVLSILLLEDKFEVLEFLCIKGSGFFNVFVLFFFIWRFWFGGKLRFFFDIILRILEKIFNFIEFVFEFVFLVVYWLIDWESKDIVLLLLDVGVFLDLILDFFNWRFLSFFFMVNGWDFVELLGEIVVFWIFLI